MSEVITISETDTEPTTESVFKELSTMHSSEKADEDTLPEGALRMKITELEERIEELEEELQEQKDAYDCRCDDCDRGDCESCERVDRDTAIDALERAENAIQTAKDSL